MFGAVYRMLTGRSSAWPALRREWLRTYPACVVCGQEAETVHHVKPVSVAPDRELDATNLASVCHRCHFAFGHCCRWNLWQTNFWQLVGLAVEGRREPK